MKCNDCDEPATVHSTVTVGERKEEIHLCRSCAEKRQLIVATAKPNLPVALKQFQGSVELLSCDLAKLACPDCGTKYMDFRKSGRLGCPFDYVVFRDGLAPLLDRVQRARHHTGKRPRSGGLPVEAGADIRRIRLELRQAIESEDYEQAARLRDLIRTKESRNGP